MTRYRHQTSPQAPGIITRGDFSNNTTTELIQKPDSQYRNMNDEVIPNFKKRSAKGEVFVNAMTSNSGAFVASDSYSGSQTVKQADHIPLASRGKTATTTYANGALLTMLFNQGNLPFSMPQFDTSTAAAKAALDAITNVNKTEVDLANFAVEWDKTRSLHRDLGNAFMRTLREGSKVVVTKATRKRIIKYDKNGNPLLNRNGTPQYYYLHSPGKTEVVGSSIRTKNASDLYLAAKMGLLPLISDLEGACKILMSARAKRFTARGTATLSGVLPSVKQVGDAIGQHVVNMLTYRTWTIRYGILYETTAAGRLAGQLGLTRPLSSAWESLPWSFVADWFVNVGQWLDAVQPSGATRNICAWVTTEETVRKTAVVDSTLLGENADWTFKASWSGQLSQTSKFKSRSVWIPTIPSSPQLAEGFNRSRSFDFAALVLQRLKTKR